MQSAIRALTVVSLCLTWGPRASAQQYVRLGTEMDDYLRLLELTDTSWHAPLTFRSPSTLAALTPAAGGPAQPWAGAFSLAGSDPRGRHLHVVPLYPDWRLTYNSAYPRTANDGALWAGRGTSSALSLGARLTWGPLTAILDPTVYWAQNRAFPLAPDSGKGINRKDLSPFAYAYQDGDIDWPQRLGDHAFAALDWGQSGLRLGLGRFTAGFTTENMWWGPGIQNAIVMSNTAPGFPHLDLGTQGPIWMGLGTVEARLLWGQLAESQYFDTVPGNDRRLFTGLTVEFRPRWINGLTLGATRAFYQTWDSLEVADFVDVFQTVFKIHFVSPSSPSGNDRRDQLLSLIARWTFPAVGFQAYVEWARNDHNTDTRDLLLEPDHSRAYTLGFQQVVPSGSGQVRVRGEVTTLGVDETIRVRATPTYYVHRIVRQGYTNRGQLIGAGIGPGSQSQYFAIDRYDRRGRLGLSFQRIRFDDDAYYRAFSGPNQYFGQQTELTAALSAARLLGPTLVTASFGFSRELNRYYMPRNDVTNLTLDLKASWHP